MTKRKKMTLEERAAALKKLTAAEETATQATSTLAAQPLAADDDDTPRYLGVDGLKELIAKIKTLNWDVKVVAELPEVGEEKIVYLVPVEDVEVDDIYAEYIWVNNAWEKLGTKHIAFNPSDYYDKTTIDNLLADKADSDDVYTKEQTYTQEQIDDKIATATGGGLTDVEAYGTDPLTLDFTKSGSKVTINGSIAAATDESGGYMSAEDKAKLDSLEDHDEISADRVQELWEEQQDYYGIEFLRGASNQGGDNGYVRLIGNKTMQETLPVHNLIKCVSVKDASVQQVLENLNFFKDTDGNDVDLAGADGSDIMQQLGGVYAIMGGTDETYDRFIVSTKPFSYGNDTAEYVPLFAYSVDYSTVVSNQQRCIYDTSVAGSMGTQNACITEGFDCYKTSAGYPKTSVSRFNYELYARNKNDDNTTNVPYCNANTIDMSFFLTLMYIEFRTKWLTKPLGNGISSNVTPSASNYGTTTGAKITSADGTVRYYALSSTALYIDDGADSASAGEVFTDGVEPLYVKKDANAIQALSDDDGDVEPLATANGTRLWDILEGGQYPMLTIMEAQRDISNGCVEGTFESVVCPDGTAVQGMENGVMTGIWTKTLQGKIECAFAADTDVEECDIELVLRVPVWRGRTCNIGGGNIGTWTSGSEVLLYVDEEGNRKNILFQANNIEDLTTDTDTSSKSNMEDWAFTQVYENLGDIGATTAWATTSIRNSLGRISVEGLGTGAARETYEGCYRYLDTSTTTTNVWLRRGVRLGGHASGTSVCVRFASLISAPSAANAYYGSGFRVALTNG